MGNPNVRRSQNSLIDDIESLVTINEHDEAVAKAIGTGMNKVSLRAIEHDQDKVDHLFGNRYQASAKIKTPMFEDDIGRLMIAHEEMDDLNLLVA